MLTADELKKLDAKQQSEVKSDAKAGYDNALKLADSVSRTIWSQYVALLATNAFLVSVGAFLYDNEKLTGIVKIGLPAFGLLICVCWFCLTARSYDFYKYYFACARELELLAFGDVVHTIRSGRRFSEGKPVDVRAVSQVLDSQTIDKPDFERQLRLPYKIVRAENVTHLIIFAFICIYIALYLLV